MKNNNDGTKKRSQSVGGFFGFGNKQSRINITAGSGSSEDSESNKIGRSSSLPVRIVNKDENQESKSTIKSKKIEKKINKKSFFNVRNACIENKEDEFKNFIKSRQIEEMIDKETGSVMLRPVKMPNGKVLDLSKLNEITVRPCNLNDKVFFQNGDIWVDPIEIKPNISPKRLAELRGEFEKTKQSLHTERVKNDKKNLSPV